MKRLAKFPKVITREWLAFYGADSWEFDDFDEACPDGVDWTPENFDALAAVVDMGRIARNTLSGPALVAFNSSFLALLKEHADRVNGDYSSNISTLSLAEFKSAVNAEAKKLFFPS